MLNELLKGQKIRIDAHKRGARETIRWDESAHDIHVDKTTNWTVRNKQIEVRIRVPINSDNPISVEVPKDTPKPDKAVEQAENQLIREIRKAFANKAVREAFIADILGILRNYPTSVKDVDRARTVIRRLSRHFGLSTQVTRETTQFAEDQIQSVATFFTQPQGTFYVELNQNYVEAGQLPTVRIRRDAKGRPRF